MLKGNLFKGWNLNLMLLLFLLVSASILGLMKKGEEDEADQKEEDLKLSRLAADQIDKMTLTDKEGVTVVLERVEKRWQVVKPKRVLTNNHAAQRLADLVKAKSSRTATEKITDAKIYGLDKPEVTLKLMQGDQSLTLSLGKSTPTGDKRYLRVDENKVVIIANHQVSPMNQRFQELRDRQLMPNVVVNEVTQVEVLRQTDALKLTKGEDSVWQVIKPFKDQADSNRVSSWLNMVLNSSALTFEKKGPTTPPDWVIKLAVGGNEKKVRLWRVEKDVWAQRETEDDWLKLASYLADDLDKQAVDMVRLRPLSGAAIPLKLALTYQGEQQLTAKKEKDQWPKPAWSSIEETLTRDAWHAVMAKDYGQPPELTVVVHEGEAQQKFLFWHQGESFVIAPPGRPVHLRITKLQGDALEKAVAALYGRETMQKPVDVKKKPEQEQKAATEQPIEDKKEVALEKPSEQGEAQFKEATVPKQASEQKSKEETVAPEEPSMPAIVDEEKPATSKASPASESADMP
ncbi:DUF4340 domain-containing protein [Magnetococcales bacterium HHB-1]